MPQRTLHTQASLAHTCVADASTVRQAHAELRHRRGQRKEARTRPQFQDPYDAEAEEEPLPEDARDIIGVNSSFNALSIPPLSQSASFSQPEAELIVSADSSTAIPEETSQILPQAVPVPSAASLVEVNGKRKAATEQPSNSSASSDSEGKASPHRHPLERASNKRLTILQILHP